MKSTPTEFFFSVGTDRYGALTLLEQVYTCFLQALLEFVLGMIATYSNLALLQHFHEHE